MGFNLSEIKQALKQPKSYIWDSYTSSKPSASNLVGKSDVAFDNTPQYSAASTADDFWRKSLESDSNYYESQGYTFDGTKWVSPNELMLSALAVRNVPVNNSWFKGNRTYWENQAKNAYSQLNSDQRGLIDKDDNGSFSLEEIRDYQRANGLVADGKLGKNTMTRLNTPSGEKTYNAGLLRTVVISPENPKPKNPVIPFKQGRPLNKIGARRFNMKEIILDDGSIAYKNPYTGFIYYNNGRVKTNQDIRNYTFENGRISYYQQGGTMNNEQELQKAFMAFLIEDASTQGITIQSEEDLVKYAESLGEDGIKAKYQEFMQKMQGGVKAKLGTKLNYVRKIKGLCADDEELVYFKKGGMLCKACQKKKVEQVKKLNTIEEFKKGRKTKKCQSGQILEVVPDPRVEAAKQTNQRHANIAGHYFNMAPSIPNLAKGAYHWFMSKPGLGGERENYSALTGIAPIPGKWSDVKSLWKTVKSLGKWGKLPKFKPGYRGTKIYEGGYGALQGNLYLSNSAKVGGGPSNVDDIEQLVIKNLQDDVTKGRIHSEYQLEKAIKQRLNNLYRLSDDDIVELQNFSEGNEKLFESRLMQLIKGHTGRTSQGTR